MTIERLREVHQARPFQPFILHLADGRQVSVSHPECLAYSPKGRTVVVVGPNETHHYIDLLLVTEIKLGDGKPQRRRKKG